MLTDGLAGFGCWVNLVAFFTLTFVAAYLVDTDLTAGVWAGTLINIWFRERERETQIEMINRAMQRLLDVLIILKHSRSISN